MKLYLTDRERLAEQEKKKRGCFVFRAFILGIPKFWVVVEFNCLLFLETFFPLIMANIYNNSMLCYGEAMIHTNQLSTIYDVNIGF